nr:DUF6350 family protein [Streptomyces sp. AJS327]
MTGWLFAGALAAVLGLGLIAALVLLLWTLSPYPDSGPSGALHIAADLWLLAHGADLLRTGTPSGVPAPIGLTPLLLSLLPAGLLFRAAQQAVAEAEFAREHAADRAVPDERAVSEGRAVHGRPDGDGRGAAEPDTDRHAGRPGERVPEPLEGATPRRILGWVCAGYLLAATAAVGYAASGPIHVDVVTAVTHLPLFVLIVAAAGAWIGCGSPVPEPPGTRGRSGFVRRGLAREPRERLLTALRAAGWTGGVLCAGGVLLTAAALVWDANSTSAPPPLLTSAFSGQLGVLLLVCALVPNAAVWAASYLLGPGFTVGGGSLVTPLDARGYPDLPNFPLFSAVPAEGTHGPYAMALAWALPALAGVVCGWSVGRDTVPVRGRRWVLRGWRGTLGTALLAACAVGAGMAALALLAGGAMGTGELARLGPRWWYTGLVALGWAALAGLPSALVVRGWRLRGTRAPHTPSAGARTRHLPAASAVPPGGPVPSGGPIRPGRPVPSGASRDPRGAGERPTRRTGATTPAPPALSVPPAATTSGTGVTTVALARPPATARASGTSPGSGVAADGAAGATPEPREDRGARRRWWGGRRTRAASPVPPETRPATATTPRNAPATASRNTTATASQNVTAPPEATADGVATGDTARWHETGARQRRWAALREASGGLVPDFEPRHPD